ncbi:MAG: hypothetical protein MJ156_00930 [Alphaproteobacteria bacterium]|nr:hypothetical protein [Alphaproteobacteria bacterium]
MVHKIILTDDQMREYIDLYNSLDTVDSKAAIKLYKKCHNLLEIYGEGNYKTNQTEKVVLENLHSPVFEEFGDIFIDEINDRGEKIDVRKGLFNNVLDRFLKEQIITNDRDVKESEETIEPVRKRAKSGGKNNTGNKKSKTRTKKTTQNKRSKQLKSEDIPVEVPQEQENKQFNDDQNISDQQQKDIEEA